MVPAGGMRLRPMTIGDIIDETIKLYRRHFLAFVTAMAVSAVFQALFSIGLNLSISGADQRRGGPSVEQVLAALAVGLPLGMITALVYFVSTAAVIWLASEAILGRAADVSTALRLGLVRLPSLLGMGILYGLAVGLLFITIIGIPFAIYLGVGWALCYQANIIERRGATASLGRSSGLVGGFRWRVLGTSILMSILTSILISIPSALVGVLAGLGAVMSRNSEHGLATLIDIVNGIVSAASQALFTPLALITMTVLYYELRVRKEAFDLEQRAGEGTEPPTVPPAYPI
jgi:hypothetical protein